jgi:putative tricarboxylic transport membrane protein
MTVRKEIASSLVLILFGVGLLLYDLKYPLDTRANPGPGVFPLLVGAVLVILSAWQMVQALRKSESREEKEDHRERTRSPAEFFRRNKSETKALVIIGVFVLYLFMVKEVGFFVSNLLFVIASSRLMGAMNWTRPIALSLGINLFCYALFEVWLKLSFPRGILF